MKMLAVLASLLIGGVASAQNETRIIPIDGDVIYLSWCDDNKVVSQDSNGLDQVRSDCTALGLECRSQHIVRMHQVIIIASCVNP